LLQAQGAERWFCLVLFHDQNRGQNKHTLNLFKNNTCGYDNWYRAGGLVCTSRVQNEFCPSVFGIPQSEHDSQEIIHYPLILGVFGVVVVVTIQSIFHLKIHQNKFFLFLKIIFDINSWKWFEKIIFFYF